MGDRLDFDREDEDPDFWVCCFPEHCLMPGLHTRDECHTAEDYEREMELYSAPEKEGTL